MKTMVPTIRSPPPTYSPKVVTTLPGFPVVRISFVEDTFSAILKIVVNRSMVGKNDISRTSLENMTVNRIRKATPMLNARRISRSQEGMETMNMMNAAKIYSAMPASAFPIFIRSLLPFVF